MIFQKIVFALLVLLFSFSCTKDEAAEGIKYNLVEWYGTIAGIKKEFKKGDCTWTVSDSLVVIDLKVEDNFLKTTTTKHRNVTIGGKIYWQIDGIGEFTRVESNDTLYLQSPCCDLIDYTLVKD